MSWIHLLNEMIKIGNESPNSYVISFNKWLYVIKDNSDYIEKRIEIYKNLEDLMGESIKKYKSLEDFFRNINKDVIDVFLGYIDNDNELHIKNDILNDLNLSIHLNKILKQLKVDSINRDYSQSKETNNIGYHGTTLNNLGEILRVGIRANKNTNWNDIIHNDKIFFSTSLLQPLFHANRNYSLGKDIKNLPIIISFNIPDKDKMIQDYDMENYTGITDKYPEQEPYFGKIKKTITDKPYSLSREKGIFGYEGNIKPNFINEIYIPNKSSVYLRYKKKLTTITPYNLKDFVKISKSNINNYVNKIL